MKSIVIKLGGEIVQSPELERVAEDVRALVEAGHRVALVHGGGPQASALQKRLGHEPKMIAGQRQTDAARAMSAQLNELGFMGYVGERLAGRLQGLSWPVAFVALAALYVLMHYLFVSQSAQVLALFGVFADVGVRSGVPAPLVVFTLLFASSWFSTITPQGGTQNVIFVGSGYLTQRELYRLGALTTAFCLVVFLAIGTPWLLLVAR